MGTASQFASGHEVCFEVHDVGRIGGSPHFSPPPDFRHGLLARISHHDRGGRGERPGGLSARQHFVHIANVQSVRKRAR